jgi:hypothetical protein
MSGANHCPKDIYAPFRCIGNSILLGMDGCLFVAIVDTRHVRRMRNKTVLSGSNDAILIPASRTEHASNVQPFATRSRRNQQCHCYEIVMPARAEPLEICHGIGNSIRQEIIIAHAQLVCN